MAQGWRIVAVMGNRYLGLRCNICLPTMLYEHLRCTKNNPFPPCAIPVTTTQVTMWNIASVLVTFPPGSWHPLASAWEGWVMYVLELGINGPSGLGFLSPVSSIWQHVCGPRACSARTGTHCGQWCHMLSSRCTGRSVSPSPLRMFVRVWPSSYEQVKLLRTFYIVFW